MFRAVSLEVLIPVLWPSLKRNNIGMVGEVFLMLP
jgi:hypothetical protein